MNSNQRKGHNRIWHATCACTRAKELLLILNTGVRTFMKTKTMTLEVLTCAMTLLSCCVFTTTASAEEPSLYMGAPVTLVEAPNGAIANKRILDVADTVGWLKPTIEQPVEGVWVLGGY